MIDEYLPKPTLLSDSLKSALLVKVFGGIYTYWSSLLQLIISRLDCLNYTASWLSRAELEMLELKFSAGDPSLDALIGKFGCVDIALLGTAVSAHGNGGQLAT
jgi:hypothetical protein